jgi:hypothetical protein
MALTDYVTINITQTAVGLTRAGFGTGLFLSYQPTWTERTRTYNSLADVAVDFSPTNPGPAYRFAQAYFSQSPAPTALIIGRGANKPTKTVQLSAINPVSNLNYTYRLFVKGTGFADATVTFTSDASPTDAEYAAGIVSALNGVAGKNYTASGASSPVTITGNAAGDWFSIEVDDVNYQTTSETTADPGVAADLTAITAENTNWYALGTSFNSKLYGVAAAGYVESAGLKQYIALSNDTNTLATSTGTLDLADQAKTNAYTRTSVHYHKAPASFMDGALMGKCLTFDPGAETWAFKTLAGVASFSMTGTHRANIVARNANSYEAVAGINITFQGKTADGNYIDTRRGLDWMQDDMQKAVFGALASNSKIPYTDPGIGIIESQVRGSLKRAADRGIIVEETIVVTVPSAASVAAIDKTTRTLNNVKFSATLQGAVHKTVVTGVVNA